jgi:hypothetical protein
MQVIKETPPPASASKMTPAAEVVTSAEAEAAEATNLESTLSNIDKVLLDMAAGENVAATEEVMAAEETAAATEEVMAAVPEKGKEIVEHTSEEKASAFRI